MSQERSGRGYILFVAIVQLILGGIALLTKDTFKPDAAENQMYYGIGLVVCGGIFLGIWFWAQVHPVVAALTALTLYLGLIGLAAFSVPESLTRGAIAKVVIIAGLFKAVSSGYAQRGQPRK